MTTVEDPAIKRKYKELKKRIRDIEDDNDVLNIRLTKAKKHINRLRLERSVLLERLERSTDYIDDSDSNSDISDSGTHPLLAEIKSRHDTKPSALSGSQEHGGRQKGSEPKPARKKKDPNAPKGPGNVFFLYSRMERDKIKDEYPGENQGDLTRILGHKWKNLAKDDKQKYYDIYKKEQEEYEEAMKSYTASASVTGTPGLETASQTEDHMSMGEDDEEDMLNEDDVETPVVPTAVDTTVADTNPARSPAPESSLPSISLNSETNAAALQPSSPLDESSQ
ncbi:hypothetical protein BC943DRAFT_166856 [Umbelopsis sp. AD052]|nr:hypothetical protein BC943DRAFT_166856 [Umbelopsis sp. AD052]